MFRRLALVTGAVLASGEDPVASVCTAPAVKYWALDTPNNECAETCLSTKIQIAEFVGILTFFKGKPAGNESSPCADHNFHSFKDTHVFGVGPLKISMDKYAPDAPILAIVQGPVASVCTAPAVKYWALDTPNNECAETCLSTKIQIAEFVGLLTFFKGKPAGNESSPCADHSFHRFKDTHVFGAGPLKILMDKYRPDGVAKEILV